jgi:prefoldin subunit 5
VDRDIEQLQMALVASQQKVEELTAEMTKLNADNQKLLEVYIWIYVNEF